MIKLDWIEVKPGEWEGHPNPHRFEAPVVDVWQSPTDSVWFANVQHFSWDDSFSGAKRVAERMYNNWVDTHIVAEAVAKERAAVVAWLRSQAESTNYRPLTCPLADAIERGEHRLLKDGA